MQEIDFVITWVDGSDPVWIDDFNRYKNVEDNAKNNGTHRYRDWEFLKYWFRSVELYAPWVRKIHFVTCGHVPDWLYVDSPKLNVVNHSEFIPKECLPTFSSRAIEFNLHRISDLSDNFVMFNDDMFLARPCTSSDFFIRGLPCDFAISNALSGGDISNAIMNNLEIINRHYSKYKVYKMFFFKHFSYKYGLDLFRTLLLLPWPHFTGFVDPHQPQPYLKDTFKELWSREESALMRTSNKKFRSGDSCNPYLFRYWQLVNGNFHPSKKSVMYLEIYKKSMASIRQAFSIKKYLTICLNDVDSNKDFEIVKEQLLIVFEKQFSSKSSYEK